jgi:hypothetical protein
MTKPVSFRRSLFFNLALSAVLLGTILLAISVYASSQMLRDMAEELTGRAIADTNRALIAYLRPVEDLIQLSIYWADAGMFQDRELDEFDDIFRPFVRFITQVSAVHLANPQGEEKMLMKLGEGYRERLVRPREYGAGKALIREWIGERAEPLENLVESSYDPRSRPWFTEALRQFETMAPDAPVAARIHWSEPYVFFTTKEPGITASIAHQAPDGKIHIFALDVLIKDIARFAERIELRGSGLVFVLVRDLRKGKETVLGVPGSALGDGRHAAESRYLPRPVREIAGPPRAYLEQALYTGSAPRPRPRAFQAGGETWWGAALRSRASEEHEIWVCAIVPQAELLEGLPNLNLLVVVATILIVGLGLLRSRRLAKIYSRPIAEMVEQSERMARLNFTRELATDSHIQEIQVLATTQERLRRSLLAVSAMNDRTALAREIRALPSSQPPPLRLPHLEAGVFHQEYGDCGGNLALLLPLQRTTAGRWTLSARPAAAGAALILVESRQRGIAGALQARELASACRAALRQGIDHASTLRETAREILVTQGPAGSFASCSVLFDDATSRAELAVDGELVLLHLDRAKGTVRDLAARPGSAAGTAPTTGVPVALRAGDVICVASLSIPHALDRDRRTFGLARLEGCLATARPSSAQDLAAAFQDQFLAFRGDEPAAYESYTLVVLVAK